MFEIDKNLKYEYILTLCKPNKEPIQMLESIYGLKYEAKFPTTDEISFNIPFYIINNGKQEKNILWDLVKGDYLIHCKRKYHETIIDEKYFLIVKPKESDNDKEVKEIVAFSLEYELNKKIIRGYNLLSRKLYSLTNEIDSDGFQIGVLNYISTLTSWSIGDIDAELLNKFRLLDVTEETILGFLVNTIQKSFGCIFIFDTVDKKINAKKIDNIQNNKAFYLSEENYIKNFSKEIDHEEIVTRLYVYGNDSLSINSINPSGSTFIEDFSFYKNTNYMSQSLIDSLNIYESLLETKTGEFNGYLSNIETIENQLTIKTNELFQLTTDLSVIQDNIDIAIQNGNSLTDLNTQKANKELEISSKNSEITVIQNQIDGIYDNIVILRESIKKTNNFTSEQLIELDFFVREKTWTDTNYETVEDLWNEIPNIFVKLNQPPITFEIDSIDFTQSVTCQRDWNKFILGDILNIEHTKFNFYMQVRLIGYSHDVDNYSLKLNFSNKDSIDDPNQYMNDLLKNAITAGTTVDYSKYKWNKSEDNSNQIANIINNALDSAKNNVLAGKNQDVVINERGISLTDITNPNEQMRIINNVLAMTDDQWNTAKLAITPGKIFAQYLFGTILAGSNLTITTGNGDFLVDSSGVEISGLALQITNGGIPQSQLSASTQTLITNAVQIDTLAPDLTTSTPTLTTINDGTIKLSITRPSATDLAGFNIWRKKEGDSTDTLIKSISITLFNYPTNDILDYIDNTVIVGSKYYYWVSAYDNQGNESIKYETNYPNGITVIDTIYPNRPTAKSNIGGWGRIDLTWQPPTNKNIKYYEIHISDNTLFTVITTTNSFIPSYTDFNRTTVNNRYYRIYSVDYFGKKSIDYLSLTGAPTLPADNSPPSAPTYISILTDNNAGLVLKFNGSTSVDASNYRIVRYSCTSSNRDNPSEPIEIGLIKHLGTGQHKYVDNYLEKGVFYYYKVYCVDNSGMLSTALELPNDNTAIQAIDTTPPNVPIIESIIAKIGALTIEWDAITDATSYKVYRLEENDIATAEGVFIAETSQLQFTDNSMVTNIAKTYQYRLTSVDKWENESAKSDSTGNATSLTPSSIGDSIAPTFGIFNDPVVNDNGTISLFWSGFSDAGSGVGGYNIWRMNSEGLTILLQSIKNKNITTYVDTNIISGQTYKYTITCFDNAGNETELQLNLNDVNGVAQAGGNNTITLANTSSSVDEYYVNSKITITSGTGNGQSKNIISYNGTTKIATVDSNWTTNPDNTSNYTIYGWKSATALDIVAPNPPSDLIVYGGLGTIMLSWTPPSDLDIDKYKIMISDDSDFLISNTIETKLTNYTETNRMTLEPRYYRIWSVDIAGNKSWDEITIPSTGYISGSGIPAIPGDGVAPTQLPTIDVVNTKCNYNGSITITWIPNITPDGDLAKYKIFRSEDGVNYYNIAEVDKDTTNYTDTGLKNEQGYYYKLSCTDYSGMESVKIESTNIIYAIDNTAPPLPNDLEAIGDLGAIRLTWTETEKGALYDIYRLKLLPEDELDYTKIVTIAGSTGVLGKLTFTDYEPPTNTASTWYYKIKTTDQWGNTSELFTDSDSATSLIVFDGDMTGTINGVPATTINSLIINSNNPYFEKGKLFWSESYTGINVQDTNVGNIVSGVGSWGTNALEIIGQKTLYYSKAIPVDVTRTYKVRFKTRQTVLPTIGGRFVQAGIVCLDSSYNLISINTICPEIASNNTNWQTFENTISPNTSIVFPSGTVYARPFFKVNATDGNGTAQVDGLDFFDITESYNAQVTADNSVQQNTSYSNGFNFDPSANGTGLSVTLGGAGTYSNKVRSIFNAIEGIKIQKRPTILLGEEALGNVWSNAVDQLKIDTDGNLLLSGKIQIGDTFSVSPTGVLNATSANITGAINCTSLKINNTDVMNQLNLLASSVSNSKLNGSVLKDSSVTNNQIVSIDASKITTGELTATNYIQIGNRDNVDKNLYMYTSSGYNVNFSAFGGESPELQISANKIYLSDSVYIGTYEIHEEIATKEWIQQNPPVAVLG